MTQVVDAKKTQQRVPLSVIIVIVSGLVGYGVRGITGYYEHDSDMRVQDAKAATLNDISELKLRDSEFAARIAVLEAYRREDSERLRRIEQKLDESLQVRK